MNKKHINNRRRIYSSPKLEMSSMIDVVFLLLIFFIVVTKPEDLMARLEVSKPAPPKVVVQELPPTTTLDIVKDEFYVNNKRYSLSYLRKSLGRIRGLGDKTAVIVTCDPQSSHSCLVKLLDLCAELDIKNVALMSR